MYIVYYEITTRKWSILETIESGKVKFVKWIANSLKDIKSIEVTVYIHFDLV